MAETEDDDGRNSPPPPDKDSKDMGITPSKSGRLETKHVDVNKLASS